jgi:hypothetical protein
VQTWNQKATYLNRTRYVLPKYQFDAILIPFYEFHKIKCATGTRFCLTKTNKKPNQEDRITAVIPIAQLSTLEPKYNVSLCAYI